MICCLLGQNLGQILDKVWILLDVARSPWPAACPLDKLWTNIGHDQTLDKVWIPVDVAHGLPMTHSMPTGQTLDKYLTLMTSGQSLDSITCVYGHGSLPNRGPPKAHSSPRHGPLLIGPCLGLGWAICGQLAMAMGHN